MPFFKSQKEIDKEKASAINAVVDRLEKSFYGSNFGSGIMTNNEEQYSPTTKEELLFLYTKYQWVFKAVYANANAIAGLPVKLTQLGNPENILKSGEAFSIIESPNPFQSWYDFIEEFISYVELVGDAFVEIGETKQLYNLRPDWVEVKPDYKTKVNGYEYKPNGWLDTVFTPEEIIHLKYFHPISNLYGLSSSQPVLDSIKLDFYAIKYQTKFFKQGFGGTTYAKLDSKEAVTPTEFERLKSELQIDMAGIDNSHKISLLENTELRSTGVNPKDALLAEQKIMNRNEVLSSFGVPLIAVMLTDEKSSTYNNTTEQMKGWWGVTLTPKKVKIENIMNKKLFHPMGVHFEFDASGVKAMQADAKLQSEVARNYVSGGIMTPNEARQKYLNLPEIEGGEVLQSSVGGGFGMNTELLKAINSKKKNIKRYSL